VKVGYIQLHGAPSTAYLDCDEMPDDGRTTGEDKHSGRPLTLVWDGENWKETEADA
jgi:hypothetical protein